MTVNIPDLCDQRSALKSTIIKLRFQRVGVFSGQVLIKKDHWPTVLIVDKGVQQECQNNTSFILQSTWININSPTTRIYTYTHEYIQV